MKYVLKEAYFALNTAILIPILLSHSLYLVTQSYWDITKKLKMLAGLIYFNF